MVILGNWEDRSFSLSIKNNCLTYSLTEKGHTRVYSFDLEGRWWTGILNEISYRRGLDGKVVAKWFSDSQKRNRKWLTADESYQVEGDIRLEFKRFVSDITSGSQKTLPGLSNLDIQILKKISAYDCNESQSDADEYQRVYKPVGILPPDQYMSVVIQLTEGCSFNTCTFCSFYQDRPFRIKTLPEVETHINSIKTYLRSGLSLRRTIFLGDANALVTPMRLLTPTLELVNKQFDIESLGGIFSFLDGFSGEKKNAQDYELLKAMGMKRIYIGLESGNDELLKFLRKPGKSLDVLRAVHQIKTGGISVGVIILLGAGGKQFYNAHVRDTINLINQMNLDLDDLVYFSELVESEGMDYTRLAFQGDLISLTEIEKERQELEMESGFTFHPERGHPHISRYDIREFVY